MGKKNTVDSDFWVDDFLVNIDPIEKYLYLYFITCPLSNIAGAYQIPLKTIACDTGIDVAMVEKMIRRFEASGRLIYREGWMCLKNRTRYNKKENTSVKSGVSKILENVPYFITDFLNTDRLLTDSPRLLKPHIDIDKNIDSISTTEKEKIDFDSIMTKWNTLPLPKGKLSKFTNSRKEKYKNRLKEGFDFDIILTKINNSTFLQGVNEKGWVITFDWLIENDKNFIKVMEGNYDNKGETVETVAETKDYDITDFDDTSLTIQGEKFTQKEYNTQKEKWARRQYLKKIGANK